MDLSTKAIKLPGAMDKLDMWVRNYNPLDSDVPTLRSISISLTAGENDRINCNNAEAIGAMIQQKPDGCALKRSQLEEKIR